jgi:hypothetical protein
MSSKVELQEAIDSAWRDYNHLHAYEISTGYDDAMDGFERKYAEGVADGLQSAYFIIYGEQYKTTTPDLDEDNIEAWL